jgi:hypothetical protein
MEHLDNALAVYDVGLLSGGVALCEGGQRRAEHFQESAAEQFIDNSLSD